MQLQGYGNGKALIDVNLTIDADMFALPGENGCANHLNT